MSKRLRTRWLVLALGLALSGAPFFGSADASPGPRTNGHPQRGQGSHVTRTRHSTPQPSARHTAAARGRGQSNRSADPPAQEDDLTLTREHVLATSASESVGRAAGGRLVNGIPVENTSAVRILANGTDTAFGTSELVGMLEHAASAVAEKHPGSVLSLGDLSRRGGGRLGSHRSHRSGRDADVGFYFLGENGAPYPARFFVRFDENGRGVTGWSHANVLFDAPRNWSLLESMIRYEGARLQYVFVTPALQEILLAEAAHQGADPQLIARAADLMSHPARGHDNHFHVRIHCPPTDDQCIDNQPARRSRRSTRAARARSHRRHQVASAHRARR